MIQRKQTLFLLASILLILFVLFVPFIKTEYVIFDSFKIEQLGIENPLSVNSFPIAIYVIIVVFLHLLTIFLFKKRTLQMRFTIFSLILSVGFYGLLLFYHFQSKEQFGLDFSFYNYSLVTPLIAAVFDFWAFKGIQKDELLVRASDRLR
ncbi:MAG: DUF4293 domain-containing protein [Bacteroidales bacterium]|nr:DUF4293 domain-containing protein [Bacteroidales bacterium]